MIDWGKDFDHLKGVAMRAASKLVGADEAEGLIADIALRTQGKTPRHKDNFVAGVARNMAIDLIRSWGRKGSGQLSVRGSAKSLDFNPGTADHPNFTGESVGDILPSSVDVEGDLVYKSEIERLCKEHPGFEWWVRHTSGEPWAEIAEEVGMTETYVRGVGWRAAQKVQKTWLP